jgi:carbamoyltransferase
MTKNKTLWGLGINCFSHDASISLLRNGELVFSCEEERLNREKHSKKFPSLALKKALDFAEISAWDVHYATYFMNPRLEISGNLLHVLKYFPHSLGLLRAQGGGSDLPIFKRIKAQYDLPERLIRDFGFRDDLQFNFVEHHLAHAASAYYPSPFEESAILTWDGRGESITTLMSQGRGLRIEKLQSTKVPHSLGHFYSAMTQYLGFVPFVDEWKVMGMSAYGNADLIKKMNSLIQVDDLGHFALDLSYFGFHVSGAGQWVSQKFIDEFGPARNSKDPLEQRHFDLALGAQKAVESAGVLIAQALERKNISKNLCLTGGVALNVLLNRRILEETSFKNYFIQPVAGDAGTSFGSLLYEYHHTRGHADRWSMTHPFLGPGYSETEIEASLVTAGLKYRRSTEVARETAAAIASNKIVGWFQGRQEIGPRALGHRSIVANPLNPQMKDILNHRVKRREHFRPFAPSVLEEACTTYFEMPKNQKSPYMILSGKVRPEMVGKLPAITHVDQTARVHTVSQVENPKYWELINEFGKITGVPVVLNTSFNENEPIVTTPTEAIQCFLRTEFDFLALGDFIVEK